MPPVAVIDPEAPGSPLATSRWRWNFEAHVGQHRDAAVRERPDLDSTTEAALRSSVAVFQLGETGEGSHLLALAARTGDRDYEVAMRLFVREEQEHARLLASILHQLDHEPLRAHWSDQVFQHARRISGLRAEVLMLLVAEIVALRFYSALADGFVDHPELAETFARIHADEVRHVDFHADTLPAYLEQWPRAVWWIGRAIWNVVLYGSAAVVAVGHRRILRAIGMTARRFFVETHHLVRHHEPRFFRPRR